MRLCVDAGAVAPPCRDGGYETRHSQAADPEARRITADEGVERGGVVAGFGIADE